MVQITVSIRSWYRFIERCYALLDLVMESLICSLNECPLGLLLCKIYLLEAQYF